MTRFAGKVAVVTGGGSGIGAAVARRIAADGGAVVIADIAEEMAATVADEIVAGGNAAVAVRTDVTSSASVAHMIAVAEREFGGLDLAHNNAGIVQPARRIGEIDDELWERVQLVNSTSVFLCLKAEIDYFLGAKRAGSIVNTASGAGLAGSATLGAYAASKHAVIGLTRTAAKEYTPSGIRVNAIAPSTVESPMTAAMSAELLDSINRSLPLGRMATVEEVANVVCFLLSDEASYVSGATINIDGALTA